MLLCLYATSCLFYVALSVCYVLLVLCCSVSMIRLACKMLITDQCNLLTLTHKYSSAHSIVQTHKNKCTMSLNNLPRDCGWKLSGWLKPALLLKRWLMCSVPVKNKINSNFKWHKCHTLKYCAFTPLNPQTQSKLHPHTRFMSIDTQGYAMPSETASLSDEWTWVPTPTHFPGKRVGVYPK